MSELRSVLFQFLTSPSDPARRSELASSLATVDLAAARAEAKQDPGSSEAAAKVVGRMILDGSSNDEVVDAAKVAAQRAPREGAGNDVALLAGVVVWRLSGQSAQAEPYFRRVRRNEPANPQVLAFYREMFSSDADASQLMQVLVQARRALKKEETDQRFALAHEMADLAEKKLGSVDRAIEVWRSVLREDGYDGRAAKALERLYREGQKWTALVELLKEEFDRVADKPETREERITRLLEIAELYRDQLRLDAMALATLQRLLDINPRHGGTIKALADTYGASGRWNDLLTVYGRLLDAARADKDVPRQADMLRRISSIWVDRLDNAVKGMEPLAEALRLVPGDKDSRDAMARIHEQRRDWRSLIELRKEELATAAGERALEVRVELARIAEEKIGDRAEAIAGWREVLAQHGDVEVALAALLALYEREARWTDAAEILRRQIDHAEGARKIELLSRLATLQAERLKEPDAAILTWAEVARLQPAHERAAAALRDAYVQQARWDDLVALYDAQGRLGDVLDVLYNAAERMAGDAERVALFQRIAGLARDRLGEPERGLRALERVLSLRPADLQVARELLPIYREQGSWSRMLATYEVLLSGAADDDDRLDLIAVMRDIALQKLNNPRQAMQWAARAYEIRPSDEVLRAGLESAAERADGWEELCAIYERRLASPECDTTERLELLDKLASIARERLGRPMEAQRFFRQIIDLDPANKVAIAALEEIYTATNQWADLAAVFGRRLSVTKDGFVRLPLLRRVGALQEHKVGDLDAAIETYREVLQLAPGDADALDALTRLYRGRERWADLADALQRRLDQVELGNEQIPLLFELSQLHAIRLRNSQKAIAGFLQILDFEPDHLPTIDALEVLRRADPSSALAVMRGLLPYYRSIRDHGREAEAMEVIIMAEPDPAARATQLTSLANLYGQMEGRRADALRVRRELYVMNPEDAALRAEVERTGRELQRMDLVAGAYGQILKNLRAAEESAEAQGRSAAREAQALYKELLLARGAVLRDDLGQGREAEACFAEVLERDETHEGAYRALEALLSAREAHEELLQLYRRRCDIIFDAEEQKRLLERIIQIARDVLGQRETAIRTAEELLDLMPDDLGAMATLAGMYEHSDRQDDHYALEELLGRWAERVEGDELRHTLACRRAALRMDRLSDAYGAVDLLGQVLGEDPGNEGARRLLERLLDHADVQLQVAALLEPIYLALKDHASQVRVLRVRRAQAESLGSTDQATALLLEIARIEEVELGNAEAAFEALREAYLMDPLRADTRAELQRLGVELEKQRELVEVWQAAIDKLPDAKEKVELLSRIAVVLDAHLDDRDGARKAYAALLALDPPDVELAKRATLALTRLHRAAQDAAALVDALRSLLRFIDKDVEQVRILTEIAELHAERLSDRAAAAAAYTEVLDIDPGNHTAMDALERIYVEGGEWDSLCRILRQRVMATDDAFERSRLWRKVGEIMRDHLKDPHQAIEAFQWIVDLNVSPKEAQVGLDAIVRLNAELERWPDVEDGLRRLTALARDDDDRAALLGRTAAVVGDKLGRVADATDLLEEVLRVSPGDEKARGMLTEYLAHDEIRERVIKILYPLYEAEHNWRALLDLEERQARHQPAGRRRLLALLQVARTQEERLGDPIKAFEVLCEALVEAGDQPELADMLDRLERLGEDPERAEALLEAYQRTVDNVLDPQLQQRVLRSIGALAFGRLGRTEPARRAYERLYEAAPDDLGAAEALEQVLVREGDFAALAELLVRRAERSGDADVRDILLVRAAELYRVQLSRLEDAIDLYQRVSPEAQRSEQVQAVLGPLFERTERWGDLAEFLRARLPNLSGRELVDTHLRLAQLYREQLGDLGEGLTQFAEALKADPEYVAGTEQLGKYLADEDLRPQVIAQLEPVFSAVADWPRLVQIQELRLREAGDDVQARIPVLLKIARLQEDQLEDHAAAFATATRTFGEDPTDRGVRELVARLALALNKLDVQATLYTEYVDGAAGDERDEVLAIVREAAELWAVALGQPRRAVPLYQRLIDARPDDRGVFPALEAALTQAEMYPELAAAYWREADTSLDEARQIEVLQRLADLALGILGDADQAISAYRRVLEARPDHEAARSRLERVYVQRERWTDLVDLLRDRLERTTSPTEREAVLLHIAELQETRLASVEQALDTIEALLGEQQGNPGAVAALERLADAHDDQRVRIFAVLRPIYEATSNTERLIAVDEWQLTQTEDPGQRHQIYREIADFWATAENGQGYAFHVLARALAEPGPEGALEALDAEIQRISRANGWLAELRRVQLEAAGAETLQGDATRRVALELQAAQISLDAEDNESAAQILRHALTVSPDHPEVLALLDDALKALADFEGLRGVLERRVEVAPDDEERIVLLRRLARLVEEGLGQPEAAESVWRRILDIDAGNVDAMNRLRRLFAARGAFEELIGVLGQQIEIAEDPQARNALRKELARIHREGRNDREGEIEALRAAVLENPSDDDAQALLAAALLAVQRHAEAAEVLLERASIAPSRERKVGLLLEVARLYTGPIGDASGAMAHYESVFQVTPGHPEAIADLMRLVKVKDSSEAAATLVIPQLEQMSRWTDLAEVYRARSQLADDANEAAEALRQLAKIRYERLSDPAGSLAASNELMDRVGADDLRPVLEYTARLSVLLDRAEEHVESLARRAARAELDPAARLLISQSAAGMAEEILGDRARALGLLATMLEAGIADEPTCRHIERLARASNDKKLLARTLAESAKLAVGQAGRSDILVRLGDAAFDVGDLAGAADAYRDALDERPGFAGAVAGLERVLDRAQKTNAEIGGALIEALENAYHLAGNRPGLAKLARLRLARAEGPDLVAALENLGRLCDEGGGTQDEALDAWGRLLKLDADHALAVERVVALAANKPLLIKAVQAMAAAIDAARDESRPCNALCIETTKILLRDLRQYTAALRALAPVLAADPDNLEALQLQIMASRASGELGVLHEALVRYARLANDPELSIPLLREAASVAEAQAEQALALADLRALLEYDQTDEQAWSGVIQLLETLGDDEGLSQALERRIGITTDEAERRALRLRLAHLFVELGGLDEAIGVYGDMLSARADDLQALQELENLQRRLGNWKEVRDVLERKLDLLQPGQRVPVLEEMAHLSEEKLGDVDESIERHRKVLLEAPRHTPSLVALWRLYEGQEKWEDLAELLEQFLAVLREAGGLDQRREVGLRLAELYSERLGEAERARALLVELLESDPNSVQALMALAAVEEQQGNDEAMRELLKRAAALQPQGVIGADLQLRLAKLADTPEKRREHLETALHLHPANIEAARELLDLSRKEGYWEQVAYLLALLASYAQGDEQRKLIIERVDLLVEKVGDVEEALRALAPVYEVVQDDVEVNRRIADALFSSGRYDEAAGMYGWLVQVASQQAKKSKLLAHYQTRLARIELASEQPDPRVALDRLKDAYKIDTTNAETMIMLADVYAHLNQWDDSLKLARAMLLQNVDQSGMVRRGDIYLRLANAHLGLKETPKALSMLRRGIEEDPQHPELAEKLKELQASA